MKTKIIKSKCSSFFLWLQTYGLFCFRHFFSVLSIFVIFLSIRRISLGTEKLRAEKKRRNKRTFALAHQRYRVRDATERKETTNFLALPCVCVRESCEWVFADFYTNFSFCLALFFFSRGFGVDRTYVCYFVSHTAFITRFLFRSARTQAKHSFMLFSFSFFLFSISAASVFCFSFFLLLLLLLPPMLACCTEAMWIFVTEHHHYRTDTEVYTDRCQLQDEVDPLHRRTRADRLSRVWYSCSGVSRTSSHTHTYVSSNTNRPEVLIVHVNTTNAIHCTHLSIETECIARIAPQVDDIYSTPKTVFARHCYCRCRRMAMWVRARRMNRTIRTRKLPRFNTLNFSVVSMRFIRQTRWLFSL